MAVLGPLGAVEAIRHPSYRGTEEVVVLRLGGQYLGLRPADGGEHRYYDVGIEHVAVFVDSRSEVDETYERCRKLGVRIHCPPQVDRDEPGYWALFFFDPDGFRIEVAYWSREMPALAAGRTREPELSQLHLTSRHSDFLRVVAATENSSCHQCHVLARRCFRYFF